MVKLTATFAKMFPGLTGRPAGRYTFRDRIEGLGAVYEYDARFQDLKLAASYANGHGSRLRRNGRRD